MPEKRLWPFGVAGEHAKHGSDEANLHEEARRMMQAMGRQRMRNDRLLVGGRAHARKRGLS